MTTEDDFHAALDADPNDWQTRLGFADFLDERDDPRAAGYRALGANRVSPVRGEGGNGWWVGDGSNYTLDKANRRRGGWHYRGSLVDGDWFALIAAGELNLKVWRKFDSRRAAEDAAALAFAKLPADRRAELLRTT